MDVNLFEAHARIATADGMPARQERTAASSVRIPPGNSSQYYAASNGSGREIVPLADSTISKWNSAENFLDALGSSCTSVFNGAPATLIRAPAGA